MMDHMFPGASLQAVGAVLLAVAVLVLAAPEAAAHPIAHLGGAAASGAEDGAKPAVDAAPCCHVGGACSFTLCDASVGALSILSSSWATLRLTEDPSPATIADGADPPPPRG